MSTKLAKGLSTFIKKFNIKTISLGGVEYLVFYKAVRTDYGNYWNSRRVSPDFRPTSGAYKVGTEVICTKYVKSRKLCGPGLHVATLDGAKAFGREWIGHHKIMLVLVRPEDVVSVPVLCQINSLSFQKVRCKRLIVYQEMGTYWDTYAWAA